MLADALLIIDLQNGVCHQEDQSIDHLEQLVLTVNSLIHNYSERPIIFVQHCDEELVEGTFAWEIIPEIHTEKGTNFVNKIHANSFYQTNLQELLTQLTITSLEVCGAQTQYCVDTTVKFAHGLGYQLQMRKSASTTYDTPVMSAETLIRFYEDIWDSRFLTLYEE